MSFRISGLYPRPFRHLRGLDDSALAAHRARRCIVEAEGGYPERVELRDATLGEHLLLVNYIHQPADTPYRASHAVYVREDADTPATFVDEIPTVMRRRLISLRAFDEDHEMVDAEVVEGERLAPLVDALLARPGVTYLHAHFAKIRLLRRSHRSRLTAKASPRVASQGVAGRAMKARWRAARS